MTMSASSRRRPKRQRTPTTLYTDDNPSTFTTKHRKGDPVEPEVKPPKPSYFFVEEDVIESPDASKRPYRRRKPYHKDDMLETTTAERLEAISQEREAMAAAAASASGPTNADQPVKRKRGRPPKNRTPTSQQPQTPTTPNPSYSNDLAEIPPNLSVPIPDGVACVPEAPPSADPAPGAKQSKRSKRPGSEPAKPLHAWTAPIHDAEGDFLSHPTRVAPILPAILDSAPEPTSAKTASDETLQQSCPKVFGNGLGKAVPLAMPQWSPLYQPDVYFDEDYDDDTNRLPEDLTPVTRSITCMTTRKPDHAYMAVGDSMGFCIVYSLETIIRPVARLESVACQQRARAEQEKIRDQQRRKRKSLVMDTSQTTIHALGMTANRVVLATALELECMDVPSQTSLWVCPLAQDRLVTSLDMHPSRYDVLVSCSLFDDAATLGQSSPLMLLQHSQNNVEVCDANAPILLRSPCCTAIWDNSKNVEDRLLFVAVSNDDLELVLVQGGSIDSWKVACKTRIPVKNSNHATRLSQSDDGTYTLVASSRGIRLYQTETLQLIHVYGDQLALHGKAIVWRDCFFVGKRLQSNHFALGSDASGNLACNDWLQIREEQEGGDNGESAHTADDLAQYVIGVPNHKGPKELTETLHVWRVEHASVVPAMSIPLPAKSDGIQGLVAAPGRVPGVDDRLVLAGRNGEGHTLLPKVESNFAGIMYPPGYQVITDNIEYIEEETELDHVAEESDQSGASAGRNADEEDDVDVLGEEDAELAEDLREAMRQSLLEQKLEKERQAMKDVDVDVVGPISDDSSIEPSLIPCRPEAYLRQAINSGTDDEEEDENVATQEESTLPSSELTTGTTIANGHANSSCKLALDPKVFISNILSSVGHANPKKKEGGGEFSFSVTAKVVISSAPMQVQSVGAGNRSSAAGRHGKRSRSANLEAMMKASIDPRLQRYMFSKQALGVDGRGSRLDPSTCRPIQHETPSQDSLVANGGHEHESRKEIVGSTSGPLQSALGIAKPDMLSSRFRSDEAAVALGLLGLSPTPTPDPEMASDASRSSSLNAQSLNQLGQSGSSGRADSTFGGSDRDSEVDTSRLQVLGKASTKMDSSCLACSGRFVIHSCGKRALPIDYDEVAKLERERKQKEEEEKKRIRAEKRRLADQRRREARKQKQRELEEQRRREEEEARMEKERLRRMEDARNLLSYQTQAAAPASIDLDRQRREMIVASYAHHLSHVHETQDWQKATTANTVTPSTMELNAVDYNQRQASVSATAPEQTVASPPPVTWERVGATQTVSVPAPAPAAAPEAHAAYNGTTARLAEVRSSMASTLSSADALVALAGLAGIAKRELPEQTTTNGQPSLVPTSYTTHERSPPSYAAAAPPIAHGFGSSALPISGTKRAIPSFAAIRGQMEVQEQPASGAAHSFLSYEPIKPAPSAAAAAIIAAAAESNGGQRLATPAATTYVWPPRTDAEGRFYTGEERQAAPSSNWPPSAS